ncbi:MAG: ABC transporter permease [Myxococcales bacterium]|nr:ABC transporter permease [Myxococcales bacterium]
MDIEVRTEDAPSSGSEGGAGGSVAGVRLVLSGTLDAAAATALLKQLRPLIKRHDVTLDLGRVASADSAGIAALAEALVLASERGRTLRAVAVPSNIRPALARTPAPGTVGEGRERPGFFERFGDKGMRLGAGVRDMAQLLADTAYWAIIAPLRGRFPPPGATSQQMSFIGADGLPIVGLIAFLLGLIMAFQAAYQLRQFGANIFVANLVGVAMVRELGPLMTAIIVAGRSGSAITAELGTMVVGEEIDALRTMGIEPIRFLVVPRIYAITFTQPALTIYANALGILGGFLIAVFYLDLSAAAYLNQTVQALTLDDLTTGLAKSLCFAWVIVIIGCFTGLRVKGGSVGVGRATTASVVASIFSIIIVDSIFTTLSTVLK